MNTLASRSKAAPSVRRTSQPKPTRILLRPGASLVSDTLPPLFNEIAIVSPSFQVSSKWGSRACLLLPVTNGGVDGKSDKGHPDKPGDGLRNIYSHGR